MAKLMKLIVTIEKLIENNQTIYKYSSEATDDNGNLIESFKSDFVNNNFNYIVKCFKSNLEFNLEDFK